MLIRPTATKIPTGMSNCGFFAKVAFKLMIQKKIYMKESKKKGRRKNACQDCQQSPSPSN